MIERGKTAWSVTDTGKTADPEVIIEGQEGKLPAMKEATIKKIPPPPDSDPTIGPS